MYIPEYFAEKDLNAVAALIGEFGFATLVSQAEDRPLATHLPLELEVDETGRWSLFGHMARANPQWRNFAGGQQVLAIFMGPHAYISPSWYDHKNVPTWNYLAVHLYGKARLLEGEVLREKLKRLMQRYETSQAAQPLSFDELPQPLIEKDLNSIAGFEITVEKIEAAAKLSQNRNEASYNRITERLKELDQYNARRIAAEMEKRKQQA